jgi:hypothetical protein
MNEDKMICTAYASDESARHMNATIELLAIALFKDACPDRRWCMQTHDQREHYRKIAQGQLELL